MQAAVSADGRIVFVLIRRLNSLVPPLDCVGGNGAMLFWALLASGQISMRKIDGWHTLATPCVDQSIDLVP